MARFHRFDRIRIKDDYPIENERGATGMVTEQAGVVNNGYEVILDDLNLRNQVDRHHRPFSYVGEEWMDFEDDKYNPREIS